MAPEVSSVNITACGVQSVFWEAQGVKNQLNGSAVPSEQAGLRGDTRKIAGKNYVLRFFQLQEKKWLQFHHNMYILVLKFSIAFSLNCIYEGGGHPTV